MVDSTRFKIELAQPRCQMMHEVSLSALHAVEALDQIDQRTPQTPGPENQPMDANVIPVQKSCQEN